MSHKQMDYKELFPSKSKLYVRKYKKRNTETDFLVTPQGHADWREELERFLLAQGTNGVKTSLILQRLINWTDAKEVNEQLEILRLEGKVQKFRIRNGYIWRATTKMMED